MIASAGFNKETPGDGIKIDFESLLKIGLQIQSYKIDYKNDTLSLFINQLSEKRRELIVFENPPDSFINDVSIGQISGDILKLICTVLMLNSDLEEI